MRGGGKGATVFECAKYPIYQFEHTAILSTLNFLWSHTRKSPQHSTSWRVKGYLCNDWLWFPLHNLLVWPLSQFFDCCDIFILTFWHVCSCCKDVVTFLDCDIALGDDPCCSAYAPPRLPSSPCLQSHPMPWERLRSTWQPSSAPGPHIPPHVTLSSGPLVGNYLHWSETWTKN